MNPLHLFRFQLLKFNRKLCCPSFAVTLSTMPVLCFYHFAEPEPCSFKSIFLVERDKASVSWNSAAAARAAVPYLLQTRLLPQGWRYKRTCFALMAYAFLNNTSCTKCKDSLNVLVLFFLRISRLICVLQSSSAISDPIGRGKSRGTVCPMWHMHLALCMHFWAFIYSHAACKCAALLLSLPSAFRFTSKSPYVTALHFTTKNQLVLSSNPISWC